MKNHHNIKNKATFIQLCFYFLFAAGLMSLFSCNLKTDYPQKVAYLDSLEIQINRADSQLMAVDTVQLHQYFKHINENLIYIQSSFTDTMDKATGFLLSDYHSIARPIQVFLIRNIVMQKELKKSRKRVKELRHDLQHNLIKDKHKAEQYFDAEKTKATELIQTSDISVKVLHEIVPQYKSENPKVDSIVTKLKKKKTAVD